MNLFLFKTPGGTAVGARVAGGYVDLTAAGLPSTIDALLQAGPRAMQQARDVVAVAPAAAPMDGLLLLEPIQTPSKAIAVGLNYVDHAIESSFQPPTYPVLFSRYRSSWVPHRHPLTMPQESAQFDYEGELVVVIGKAGRRIRKEDALDHVFGYSIFNDGSVRDYQFKSPQWLMGKNFDRSGAFGPEIVTADALPPGAKGLRLQTRLNGRTVQDANTDDMIFDVATLIAVCSEPFELVPGDILISGTPAGVGFARTPPLFMKPGDTCEVEIEGVGLLANAVA